MKYLAEILNILKEEIVPAEGCTEPIALAYAAAGSDARMNGCPLPVMTTSGSGNQGMTCSLPIIRFCKMKGKPHDALIRALFVSHMITIHIKEVIGRLSAYCGAMAASAGVAGEIPELWRWHSRAGH